MFKEEIVFDQRQLMVWQTDTNLGLPKQRKVSYFSYLRVKSCLTSRTAKYLNENNIFLSTQILELVVPHMGWTS